MPITREVYEILYGGKNPREAVQGLLSRLPRSEREDPPEGSCSF
jgi:glycerol-3-phosphate dehydrogenase